jgi:moderate conductance mechanosensitive channel
MEAMVLLAQRIQLDDVEWWAEHGIRILIVMAVAVVVTLLAGLAVRRLERKLSGSETATSELILRRTTTVTHALVNFIRVLVWTITALLILGEFGVSLAPLLAGAGIAGIALGFGAQSLVRDWLTGFFIVTERQFDVGDTLDVHTTAGVVSGRVESLTLRTTSLRAFDGSLHSIPNGYIQVVSNKTRGWARAIVDVRIAFDEDVESVRAILEELFTELRETEPFAGSLKSGPEVLGMDQLSDFGMVVRVVADTRPSKRYEVERALREAVSRRLADREISVPVPGMPKPGPTAGDSRA